MPTSSTHQLTTAHQATIVNDKPLSSEHNAEEQLHRLFSITACRTQVELANLLCVSIHSVRNAIKKVRRGADIPATWLVSLSRTKGVPPEWILTGNGPSLIFDTNNMDPLHACVCSHYESDEFMNASPCTQKALQELSTNILLREILYREQVKPVFFETGI